MHRRDEFPTVERAVNYLRDDTVKTIWLRQVTAKVSLAASEEVRQTRHLKGEKYKVIKALEDLERSLS